MDATARLIAIEDIKVLKARYFRAADLKDYALARTVFTEDVEWDFRGATTDPETGFNPLPEAGGDPIRGVDNVIAMWKGSAPGFTSVHQGFMPDIEIIDSMRARGIWSMCDMVRLPSGPIKEFKGYGHYHETYRNEGQGWRIATIRLTRLRMDYTRE